MADVLPGNIDIPALSPLYVGGMPLEAVTQALQVNSSLLAAQRQSAEARFWATPARGASDPTREVFEVNLSDARKVNRISFDLPRFPHEAHAFYRDAANTWQPLLDDSGQPLVATLYDSVPLVIPPPPPGSTGHPQHFGAGHWVTFDHALTPVTASQFRLVLVRTANQSVPLDLARNPVPYSLGVRAFNIGYRIRSREDIPRTTRSEVAITESESFASTTDLLGSPVQFSVRENRASDLLAGAMWRSEPQPIANAVVNLYVDARDATGAAQVIDRFHLDPLTSGVHLNLYYSDQVPTGDFVASDSPLSFPLAQPYGTVTPQESGVLFPSAVGYLDLDNSALQFDTTKPFWLGMVFQPQFDTTEATRHVLLDTGDLRLEWSGTALQAVFNGVTVSRDDLTFGVNEVVGLVVAFDGQNLRVYTDGVERAAATGASTVQPVVVRLGGLLVDQGQDPGYGQYRLNSLILKDEAPPVDSAGFDAFLASPSAYICKPTFASQDTGTSNNAVLRVDPSFQTGANTERNPYGLVGGPGDRYADLVWTPINRDFKLHRGFAAFNPVAARFFKFEFTNLVAQPYDDYAPMTRSVQVFPTALYQAPVGGSSTASASGNTAGGATTVSTTVASTSFADQVRTFTTTAPVTSDGSYLPTEALFSTSPQVAARLRDASIYFNFQAWHQPAYVPRFVSVQKHAYETIEVVHTQRVAYFVGLNSLSMFRVDYTVAEDTDQYIENFADATHLAVDASGNLDSGWLLVDGALNTPTDMGTDLVTASSVVYASQRKVTAIQFASQQTPATQLLTDPDFNDRSLLHWAGYGDAAISASDDFTTDIGTTVLVVRSQDANFWSTLEERFTDWDAIEAQGLTWDDLEARGTDVGYGGITSTEMVDPSLKGRIYAAARVIAPSTLNAPLYVQIVDGQGTVLAEEAVTVTAGQVAEWYTSYTIGEGGDDSLLTWDQLEAQGLTWDQMEAKGSWDQVDQSQATLTGPLTARVVQQDPTNDTWYVDNLSVFDDAIIWEFSNDGGASWYPVYDIRNDPNGVFVFPPSTAAQAGTGLCWRVTGGRAGQRVDDLVIRPWYDTLPTGQPYRESIQVAGPNQAPADQYGPIEADPRFHAWHKPIPEEWWFSFRQWLLQHHPVVEGQFLVAPSTIAVVPEMPSPVQPLYLGDSLTTPTGG